MRTKKYSCFFELGYDQREYTNSNQNKVFFSSNRPTGRESLNSTSYSLAHLYYLRNFHYGRKQ